MLSNTAGRVVWLERSKLRRVPGSTMPAQSYEDTISRTPWVLRQLVKKQINTR